MSDTHPNAFRTEASQLRVNARNLEAQAEALEAQADELEGKHKSKPVVETQAVSDSNQSESKNKK